MPRKAIDPEVCSRLQAETGLSRLTIWACLGRGLEDADSIRSFLDPRLAGLPSPSTLAGMDAAVARLALARGRGEKVRVYGDYDVDGTAGSALLAWVFEEMGFRADATQPDRFRDGYGLHPHLVDEASDAGAKVLVTVDCGISSFDAARRARERGIDLVILDHHQIDPERGLPDALAVVNPQRADCPSGLRELCGCGVAFFLAMALRARGRADGWFEAGLEPNLKRHLDLVVIATAADMVPVTGANRILARHGMEVLKHTTKPGVRALMASAGIEGRDVSPGHLGFALGPRINASGRMASAGIALELLTTKDPSRATELAASLEELNRERMETQDRIWGEVRAEVEAGLEAGKFAHGIAVGSRDWHEGVVGIVATRVVEAFRRPAVVIAIGEEKAKGSARTCGGKDVLAALRACSGELLGYGGHRHAAGVSLEPARLGDFARAFDAAVGALADDGRQGELAIDGEGRLADFHPEALLDLEKLAPFGPGNPEPVFAVRATAGDRRVLKEKHLKLRLSSERASVEAIWFNSADSAGPLQGEMEWAGVPELNRFRGSARPSFRVRDARASEDRLPVLG